MPDDILQRRQSLRWHWLWLLPLILVVLVIVELHTLTYGFSVLGLWWRRWTWGALVSPSSAFCLSVLFTSFTLPPVGLWGIAILARDNRPWRYVALTALFIFAMPLITDALIWGSFPFTYDAQGQGRLRMIPFVPWPDQPYGEY